MISSLLIQQCPACLVRIIWLVFEMGGRWQYSGYFVGNCIQDLFNIAHSILVQLLSSFFSIRLISIHVVLPYSSMDMTTPWKKLREIFEVNKSNFHLTNGYTVLQVLFFVAGFVAYPLFCLVYWGCRIHRLHLCREVRLLHPMGVLIRH